MGLGGLSLAWRRAALVWGVTPRISEAIFWVALATFGLLAGMYAAKWARHPAAARAELRHPVRMAFVPTTTISLLILATAGQGLLPEVSRVAWWIGAVGHLTLTVVILGAWFGRPDIGLSQVTPAWFIPVVGNVITPLAAPSIGSTELGWFAWGVGVVFWVALLPVLMLRVLLHSDPLPPKLLPTLAIFIAPPAIIGLSWTVLTGTAGDPVFRVFYSATIVFVLLVAAQLPVLRTVPFALPYWAYTFPLTAASAMATAAAAALPGWGYDVVAVALLAVATLVVAGVAVLTLRAAAHRQICVPE
jgi:tellurite resistance protein